MQKRYVLLQFYKHYKCPDYYGDPCYCKNNGDGWVLDHISYEGIVEVYPN